MLVLDECDPHPRATLQQKVRHGVHGYTSTPLLLSVILISYYRVVVLTLHPINCVAIWGRFIVALICFPFIPVVAACHLDQTFAPNSSTFKLSPRLKMTSSLSPQHATLTLFLSEYPPTSCQWRLANLDHLPPSPLDIFTFRNLRDSLERQSNHRYARTVAPQKHLRPPTQHAFARNVSTNIQRLQTH